jgi:glycogen debranching enzyme
VLDPRRADRWRHRAEQLRGRLAAVLSPDVAVMAVEAGDAPVPGAGSQLGWLLWAGALPPDLADVAARRLVSDDVLTPYGLRTLSSAAPQFRPDGYHRGAIWPFDSWLGWGGLRAHGRLEEAERLRTGVLSGLDRLGRAPELYSLTPEGEPAPVPIANRVQAWTVGAREALRAGWDGRAAQSG